MLLRVSKPSSSWTWSDGSIIWIAESSRGIFPIYYVLIEILLYFIILIISYKFRNILRLYFELSIHFLYIIIQIFSFNAIIITILSILIFLYFGGFILRVTFSFKISSVILWTAIFFIHIRIIRGREVFNRCTRCDWTALVIIFSFVLIKKLINFPFYFVRFLQYSIFQIWRAVYILYLRAFITLMRWSFIFLKFLINLIIALCILILLLMLSLCLFELYCFIKGSYFLLCLGCIGLLQVEAGLVRCLKCCFCHSFYLSVLALAIWSFDFCFFYYNFLWFH